MEPAVSSVSLREPEPIQMPKVSEPKPGIVSVMMRIPDGRTVRATALSSR